MIAIEDLIRALRMLPADTGVTNWELTYDGGTVYTLDLSVIFTLTDGTPPAASSITAALSAGED